MFLDVAREATVLLGDASASTIGAAESASIDGRELPLVYAVSNPLRYECCKDVLVGSNASILLPDIDCDLEALVDAAKARAAEQAGPRAALLRRFYGALDGYEEYRVALRVLRAAGATDAAVSKLEALRAAFSSTLLTEADEYPVCAACETTSNRRAILVCMVCAALAGLAVVLCAARWNAQSIGEQVGDVQVNIELVSQEG